MKSHDDTNVKTASYVCEFPSYESAVDYFKKEAPKMTSSQRKYANKVKVARSQKVKTALSASAKIEKKDDNDISELGVVFFFQKHSEELTKQIHKTANDGKAHGVLSPDDERLANQFKLDDEVINSPAYKILLRNFNEIAKNYLFAGTSTLTITFNLNKDTNSVEISLDSKQKKPGFNVSFQNDFAEGKTRVDYADILKGKAKIESTKDSKKSFGGKGQGFALLSQSLNKAGGNLILESNSEHPALLILQSPLKEPELTKTAEQVEDEGEVSNMLKRFSLTNRKISEDTIEDEEAIGDITFLSSSSENEIRIESPTVTITQSTSQSSVRGVSPTSKSEIEPTPRSGTESESLSNSQSLGRSTSDQVFASPLNFSSTRTNLFSSRRSGETPSPSLDEKEEKTPKSPSNK